MDGFLTINVDFEGESESLVLKLASGVNWNDLEMMLKLQFDCDSIAVKYLDDENDEVTMSSQVELEVAVKGLGESESLHIKVSGNRCVNRHVDGSECVLEHNPEDGQLQCPIVPPRPEKLPARETSKPLHQKSKGGFSMYEGVAEYLAQMTDGDLQCHRSLKRCHQPQKDDEKRPRDDKKKDDKPPIWFKKYMDKREDKMAKAIAKKTVQKVLQGLEGAVVHTLPGTSCHVADTLKPSNGNNVHYYHSGVVCDYCEQTIVGVRYKCGNCPDFDLCGECEALDHGHDPDHIFLKVVRPVYGLGRHNGRPVPILQTNHYLPQSMDFAHTQHTKHLHQEERHQRRLERQKLKDEGKREKEESKMKLREEKLKRRLDEGKEMPNKKERLDLPQFRTKERMDCELVKHDTFPDGTAISSDTKFFKRWVVRNMGNQAWTAETKLKLIWGTLIPIDTEVHVPHLKENEEGVIEVELMAPSRPGIYQSHWRMYHSNKRFGHRIWCNVAVLERELLEPSTSLQERNYLFKVTEAMENVGAVPKEEVNTVTTVKDESTEASERSIELEDQQTNTMLLTAKDVLVSFEMLNIADKKQPKKSQTTTPNNTPLDVTPPSEPNLDDVNGQLTETANQGKDELETNEVSNGNESGTPNSSVTSVANEKPIDQASIENSINTVRDQMQYLDIESLSTLSEDSFCTENDYYIVPLPDCFNLDKPLSQSTVNQQSFDSASQKSVDDLLTTSNSLDTQPLTPSPIGQSMQNNDGPLVPPRVEVSLAANDFMALSQQPLTPLVIGQSELTPLVIMSDDQNGDSDVESDDEDQHVLPAPPGEEIKSEPEDKALQSPVEMAGNLASAAVGFVGTAVGQAYCTAKGVYTKLQNRKGYAPPKKQWTPPETKYVPPQLKWSPPEEKWIPMDEKWLHLGQTEDTAGTCQNEAQLMNKLIDMGFANRAVNEHLLEKYNNDIEKVISELIHLHGDNEWHVNRH